MSTVFVAYLEILVFSILETCYYFVAGLEKGDSMTIQERIVICREKKGWSQRELANRVNINYSVMNRIESGTRPIKDHELNKLANVLDVSADYLLGRSTVSERNEEQDSFNPLDELRKYMLENNMQNMDFGFYDIEKWKKLSREDVEDLKKHFDYVYHRAKEREEKE